MFLECPNGHTSEELDFCSVCGVAIAVAAGAAVAVAASPRPAATAAYLEVCPRCGEERADLAGQFCENCRYNFAHEQQTADLTTAGDRLVTASDLLLPLEAVSTNGRHDETPVTVRWELVITVDPEQDLDPDPRLPCPVGAPDQIFPVDLDEMLIGRRDQARGIYPEIPLVDNGVSRRHAQILRQPDGSLVVRDLGSANGTHFNEQPLPAGVAQRLAEGDTVRIGRWSKLTIRRRG